MIDANSMNNSAVLVITDSGVGMNRKIIDKIFEIEIKKSQLGTENESGTRLDLVLCKEVN